MRKKYLKHRVINTINIDDTYQKYSSDSALFKTSAREREVCVNVRVVLARRLRTGKYTVTAIHIPSILISHTFNN